MGHALSRWRLIRGIVSLLMVSTSLSGSVVLRDIIDKDTIVTATTIIVDINGGGNFTTIQDAIDASDPGDTIYILSGQYFESLSVYKTLTLIGMDPLDTTINGNQVGNTINITADHVNISGFQVRGGRLEYPYAGVVVYDSDDCTISNCHITDNQYGIRLFDARSNRMENLTISDNTVGMKLFHTSSHNQVSNCTISSNYYNGIVIASSGGSYNQVSNNTISFNDENDALNFPALWCSDDHNVIAYNNISSNSGTAIYLSAAHGNTITNNTYITQGFGMRLYDSANNLIEGNLGEPRSEVIYLSGSCDNIIRANTISGLTKGIWLDSNSSWNQVYDNVCELNSIGIYTYESPSNSIHHNICNFNVDVGIKVSGPKTSSSDTVIDGNSFSNNSYGIHLINCQGATLSDNVCRSNLEDGILVQGLGNSILNNTCDLNCKNGMVIEGDTNTISNNICDLNRGNGILSRSSYNTLLNNSIASNGLSGIRLEGALSNVLESNIIINCGLVIDGTYQKNFETHTIGTSNLVNSRPLRYIKNAANDTFQWDAGQVILSACRNISIEHQYIHNASIGAQVAYCVNITISNSTFYQNILDGMLFMSTTGSTIENNIMENNSRNGLHLISSGENLIKGNSILGNGNGTNLETISQDNILMGNDIIGNHQYGLCLISNSNGNELFHNNIIDNAEQAHDGSHYNGWSNELDEGNHWSDYIGTDNGANGRTQGDGIGDTQLPHLGLDYHPYMEPDGWFLVGSPNLVDPGDLDSDGYIELSWNEVSKATGYILQEDGNRWFDSPITVFNGSSTYTVLSSRGNGTYYYRLRAYNPFGNSQWSNMVNITVDRLPGAPSDLHISAYPYGNVLNLTWRPTTEDTLEYDLYFKVEKSWQLLASLDVSSSCFDHTGLENGQRYYYKVQARDLRFQLSEFSDTVFGIPMDSIPPRAPTGLVATDVSQDSIGLGWDRSDEVDIGGYNIYRSFFPEPTSWGTPLNGPSTVKDHEYVDSGLEPNTTYFYAITALDQEPNESDFSNMASATTRTFGTGVNENTSDRELDPGDDEGILDEGKDNGSTLNMILVLILLISMFVIFYSIRQYNRKTLNDSGVDPGQSLHDSLYGRALPSRGKEGVEQFPLDDATRTSMENPEISDEKRPRDR